MIPLPLGAAALSVLELDETHVGQFMLSRPIVFGPLLGWLLGSLTLGIVIGGIFELLTLEGVPVGAALPPSPALSAGSALLLVLGPAPAPIELAVPAGIGVGQLHARAEAWLRQRRNPLGREAAAELSAGRPCLGKTVFSCVLAEWLLSLATLLLAAYGLRPALSALWSVFPDVWRAGFEQALALAPWLGAAVLGAALRGRK
jgi:mannose/fructose/N-acetylgalactosamine-specific phosphotransferase system component IIC